MQSQFLDLPTSLQEIPPQWAHFCLNVDNFIAHELKLSIDNKTSIVGFSGGVDSTALILTLQFLAKRRGGRIVAAHMNHNLRKEAQEDSQWCEAFCKKLGIECFTRSEDIRNSAKINGIGIEEAGRDARYKFFQDIMRLVKGDFVMLGHHLDDLCEDVLMRLTRGTAWPGLAGMSGFDPHRTLVRPFLLTPKSELKSFLQDLKVGWREDASNQDDEWTRNRVRTTLLPLFLKENPKFRESIARMWKIGRIDSDYWNQMTSSPDQELSQKVLLSSHKALRLRLFKAALDNLGEGQALAKTLFKLDQAWCDKKNGAVFQFPGNKVATITASGVVFSHKH
ncbi:tRNA lysidine(34) synthetase TilS [Pseudodesulfovibrio piezophilus]|uniref:tRNA(Ile)-lysidine synthase n=1 Tax=Pseudodesulfovibrio piezophilus (strain DSM 21447 / JCM 15486 / C1TLV30) TaxID=1322246 RepID=M1WJI5_PSEP2|nr:tRNA lysidine(34) synthetase TilS [Pseudodesulfovibrio piezophilus]CCH47956.1 tRNA(Ile)-lysidine synthase [Pseudodesulfovibrio piezophilus C1TLV30]